MSKPLCTVLMDGEMHASEDFVAILSRAGGEVSVLHHTDAITLGMAIKAISREFVQLMNSYSLEEREDISNLLGDAFICDTDDESK